MKKSIFVFEGGEGSGKGTQIKIITDWLSRKGLKVKTSREPGGSVRGEELRKILLSKERGKGLSDAEHSSVSRELVFLADLVEHSGIQTDNLPARLIRLSEQRGFSLELEMALFIVARFVHLEEVIKPYIYGETEDDILVLDRFWGSTVAYQVHTRCATSDDTSLKVFIHEIFEWHLKYLVAFDICPVFLILDVDPLIGLKRGDEKTSIDGEQLPFHRQVRKGYERIFSEFRSLPGGIPTCVPYKIDGSLSIDEVTVLIQEVLKPYVNEVIVPASV